ncbi:PE domain-containing protein [Mycobacterium malmoense]|uniref:PE family protein n=1 Tax=Mycobacterium malmoense TaxID=1780 RepID=A0ABX3SKP7_MYCMA|nr:PE domain-containing protein [Mycobacterium malmoense]OIN78991.1 PE family protein [Mycobacterium malmoense]ORA77664.1 PE family protein [Mycobacterium malmoense]QZA16760.1 PE domain-containing protein [Mycobacterium malmoense]UNB93556.1 PE domain-containing protein [Mycobacterium malmoense]
MSFLTTIPEELLSAATQLEGIGNSLTAQNAGAAAPTTAIAPAAADPVSALQASIFSSYGTLYQQIAAEAQAIQQQFVSTLGLSSGTYSDTEAANVAASSPIDSLTGFLNQISTFLGGPGNSVGGNPLGLSSNGANFLSYEGGNWASAMSDCLGMAGGGLIDWPATDAASVAGAADLAGTTTPVGPGMGGMGAMAAMPVASAGQATMVGKLSVPPSWAGSFTPGVSPATAVQTVGWTSAAPQAGPGTIVPGMPGLGAAARNSAGFGAPRYGVKPIVMPKVKAV